MKLMIIESPAKRKTLQPILAKIRPGEQWRIESSVGHFRDLPASGNNPDHLVVGVDKDFRPIYEVTENKRNVLNALKKAVKEASEVYLATDPDREGESISWHLKEALNLKNPIRVTFNDINAPTVKAALDAPRKIDVHMVVAQEARRVLDRLVGYMVSPELRRQTGDALTAGRVQSPAVYLVVLRERKIREFSQTNHFGVRLIFAHAKMGSWRADWQIVPDFASKESPYVLDRAIAEQVAAAKTVTVERCEEKQARRAPPAPFTTALLQQAASNALRFKPKQTMQLAQKLYEQGHISYMRTDNPNIGDDAMGDLRAVASAMGLPVVSTRRTFEAKEGAQEGHPAITPKYWDVTDAGESDDERALYKLIRNRAIASQLEDAIYDVRKVLLRAELATEGKSASFVGIGRTLTYKGWLTLLDGDSAEEKKGGEGDDDPATNPVPSLAAGEVLQVHEGKLLAKATKPPARYREAGLIAALEKEGIGRPSTYASIIDNIFGRSYVEEVGGFIRPTPIGEKLIATLEGNFDFLQLGFTKELEDELDRIAKGKANYTDVISKLYHHLYKEIETQKNRVPTKVKEVEVFPCPGCGSNLRRISKSANGPFWGCTAPREKCSVTLPDDNGKPGQRKNKVELSNFACEKCGKPLVHMEKKGKGAKEGYDFWGCSGFQLGCKTAYPNNKGKPLYSKAKE